MASYFISKIFLRSYPGIVSNVDDFTKRSSPLGHIKFLLSYQTATNIKFSQDVIAEISAMPSYLGHEMFKQVLQRAVLKYPKSINQSINLLILVLKM